jgi:4-hydroxy-2-oxoheptanedioate aldolase
LIRENKTRAKLKRGQPVFGVIGGNDDPAIAELIGLAGFDFYMMDAEHGALTPAQAANIVRACEVIGITPLARVGQKDAKLVLQYLDAGVAGIMMPGLRTADEVRELVAAMKYPPLGKRGLGMGRANDFMIGPMPPPDYVKFANDHTLVLPQFEEAELLAQLPEMAAVEGVDGIVFGPRDLSLSMGYLDGPNHPEVQAVINRAITIIRGAGLAVGITAGTAEAARAEIGRGATFILNAIPTLIQRSAREFLADFRNL